MLLKLALLLFLCTAGSGWRLGGSKPPHTFASLRLPTSSSLASYRRGSIYKRPSYHAVGRLASAEPGLGGIPSRPDSVVAQSYRSTAKWNAVAQLLLTGLSYVALATAAAHRKVATPQSGLWSDALGANVVSTLLSGVSILWSWSTLLSLEPSTAAVRRFCSMSIGIGLTGMFVALAGALQSAGEWVSRAHREHGLRPFTAAPAPFTIAVTAAEILLTQACANILASHFLSLASHLFLLWQVKEAATEAAVATYTSTAAVHDTPTDPCPATEQQ